jgi:signal transduction histidine kinase
MTPAPETPDRTVDLLRALLTGYRAVTHAAGSQAGLAELAALVATTLNCSTCVIAGATEGGEVLELARTGPEPVDPILAALHPVIADAVVHGAAEPSTLLAVPIITDQIVLGALAVADPVPRTFTSRQVATLRDFALVAATALHKTWADDNDARTRVWLDASARVTRELLGAEGGDPLEAVIATVREIAAADFAGILMLNSDGRLHTVVTVGGDGAVYAGASFSAEAAPLSAAMRLGVATRYRSFEEVVLPGFPNTYRIGPVMLVPLAARVDSATATSGIVCIGRAVGRPEFTAAELGLASVFASHIAMALELAAVHAEAERARLSDERGRIARELHDLVIQRLFVVGMGLQSVAGAVSDPKVAERLRGHVRDLDDTLDTVRSTVAELRFDETAPAGDTPPEGRERYEN